MGVGMTRMRAGGAALAVTVGMGLACLLVPGTPAGAAGVTTHAWMAATAIDQVASPELKALLQANRDEVRAGAHFPDSGYALTNTYGEEAHWQRFVDALVQQIRARRDCEDLTAVHGPCAELTAFLFGIAAHGMGDEVWDWLFEPTVADNQEYFTPAELGTFANEGGAETQMDIAAIGLHHQPTTALATWPDQDDLLAAFDRAGFGDADPQQLALGQAAMGVVNTVEAQWAVAYLQAQRAAMPYANHNFVTGPGGIDFAATAIAGYWDNTWGQLIGSQPRTEVSITYPAPEQRRIPATGWVRDHQPGSGRGRGGARTRIAAALTYSRPYVLGSTKTVSAELPPGAMVLTERDTGTTVPPADGYPRSVPYGPDAGEHVVDFEPAGELRPCTWYTVAIGASLVDEHGRGVVPYGWDFRTGADADGGRCADDPFTADERLVRAATTDLLGRDATSADLHDADHGFDRGATRRATIAALLDSPAARTKLVDDAFSSLLGRTPDAGEAASWTQRLASTSVTELRAALLGSAEAYRAAGSTDVGFVQALYPLVLGHPADDAGARYWADQLDAGLTRTSVARRILTSHEAAHLTVVEAYRDLLGRDPDVGGDDHWTAALGRGTDPRPLWLSLVLSREYDRAAQAG